MILLDTHAWIRWLHPELGQSLPPQLRYWLENADAVFAISVISCLEVAQLIKKGRLWLPLPLPQWYEAALGDSDIITLPLSPNLLFASTQLPDIHHDPADRIIIATAQAYDAYLITKDEDIQKYPNLRTLWKTVP